MPERVLCKTSAGRVQGESGLKTHGSHERRPTSWQVDESHEPTLSRVDGHSKKQDVMYKRNRGWLPNSGCLSNHWFEGGIQIRLAVSPRA